MSLKLKKPDDLEPSEGGDIIEPPKRSKRWCKTCGRKHAQRQFGPRECDLIEVKRRSRRSGKKYAAFTPRGAEDARNQRGEGSDD